MFIETEDHSRILIVDPDPALRDRLDLMFNGDAAASLQNATETLSYIFQGRTCGTAAEADICLGLESDKPYQLIFVENELPDGEGIELIRRLWLIDPNLHAVLCSSGPTLNWQQVVAKLGESDQLLILEKPFSALELRQIVHAVLRKWQLNRQSQHIMRYMDQQIELRTQAIEQANKNLLQAEKLAAVGQLAAGIAHEINTPAQYVGDNIKAIGDFFGSITRLLEQYRKLLSAQANHRPLIDALERKEDLAFILEDAPLAIEQSLEGISQIVRIVQAMKGFSHSGQSNAGWINVNLALENTLLIARNSYKYIAEIETDFAEVPNIECFPGELNQVFLNVLINAAQAIEDGGSGDGRIRVSTASVTDGVEIRIADNGPGIPEPLQDRIFDPFFTTKDVGKGSGQGLYIAHRIINQQHGGSLSFVSAAGQGTTFLIRLNRQLPK
ncbi:sensor histidine kinase [Methylomonas koyamae]|uniref:sensor histidine kinase n=1 Tax=Methylomonas koyamae TaxID=702114 RepID=UPI0011289B05|nr:ATP-binding protein [Methylomonas koyamae]TPQ25416.1 hypothetical protein C2U68_14985 [Methylomonas koyamae]